MTMEEGDDCGESYWICAVYNNSWDENFKVDFSHHC